jgi:hypothetical protein
MKIKKFLTGVLQGFFVDARFDAENCRVVNCKEGSFPFFHEFRHVEQCRTIPFLQTILTHFFMIVFLIAVVSIIFDSLTPIIILLMFQVAMEFDAIFYAFEQWWRECS